jgi:hypothetical protein
MRKTEEADVVLGFNHAAGLDDLACPTQALEEWLTTNDRGNVVHHQRMTGICSLWQGHEGDHLWRPVKSCKRCNAGTDMPTVQFAEIKYGVPLCDRCYLLANKETGGVLCRSCGVLVSTTDPTCEASMRAYNTIYCSNCHVKPQKLQTRLRRPESKADEDALEALRLFQEVLLRKGSVPEDLPDVWWQDMLTEMRRHPPNGNAQIKLHTVVLASAYQAGKIDLDEYLALLPKPEAHRVHD